MSADGPPQPGRRLALGVWLAALAFCLYQLAHTRFVADLSMFLPDAPTEEQRLLVDQLRDGALTRMVLIGIDGADAPTRARISAAMKQRLEQATERKSGTDPGRTPVFVSVANGQSGGFEKERELLLAHRYALSPNVTPARFSVEGLRAAVDETVDLLASPAGALVKGLVARDPTGEMLAVIERLRPGGGPRTVNGVWASPDGSRALLVARTRAAGSDIDAQAQALAAVEAAFKASAQGAAALVVTGPAVFSVRSRALIKHDVERLALASLGLVVAILLSVYRSPVLLGLGLVPVACGALAGVAAVSLGFGAVHGITLGFGTTLIGEAIDYSIYLFVQSEQRDVGGAGWVAGFWPTIRLGVLTSIAGFSALLFSGLPGLAQLGLYSITGLVAAALVTRFVLPSMLPRNVAIRDLSALGESLSKALGVLARARWVVAAAAVAAVAVLATHGRIWDRDLASLNPISAKDRQDDARMRADLATADARIMVAARGASADAALASAERVGARLDTLVAAGTLGGYDSPAKVLPSLDTQRARLASLPPAAELRARLDKALVGSPLSASRLGAFVEDVERARAQAPLTREALDGTAMAAALEGLLFADSAGRWTALVGLRAAKGAGIDVSAVRQALVEHGLIPPPDALVIDLKAEADRLYAGYFERALLMSAVGLAVIVALLFGALRDAGRVARVMLPLAAAVLVVAAVHALAGTLLNLLHLVGLLLVVAIGSNYALFFDRIGQGGTPAARTLASLTLANITTVASFGVLALSDIPVLRAMGSTVSLGAFAALVFSAMLSRPGVTIGAGTR